MIHFGIGFFSCWMIFVVINCFIQRIEIKQHRRYIESLIDLTSTNTDLINGMLDIHEATQKEEPCPK